MLKAYGDNIWAVRTPLPMGIMDLTTQMVIVRLPNQSLIIISPIEIDESLKKEINDLGEVTFIISPNNFHHMFAGSAQKAFPEAMYLCSEALAKRVKNLPDNSDSHQLKNEFWQNQIQTLRISPSHFADEIAFFHPESKTLILTDLLQIAAGDISFGTKIFAFIAGTRNKARVSRIFKLMVKNKQEMRDSLNTIATWDFETILLAHNANLESNAKTQFQDAIKAFG